MEIRVIKENNIEIAIVNSDEILITDVQSALDFFTIVDYETECSRMIINKSSICEEFFDLSTKIGGEILQDQRFTKRDWTLFKEFSDELRQTVSAFIER